MCRVGSLPLPDRATSMGEWLVTAYDPSELLRCQWAIPTPRRWHHRGHHDTGRPSSAMRQPERRAQHAATLRRLRTGMRMLGSLPGDDRWRMMTASSRRGHASRPASPRRASSALRALAGGRPITGPPGRLPRVLPALTWSRALAGAPDRCQPAPAAGLMPALLRRRSSQAESDR